MMITKYCVSRQTSNLRLEEAASRLLYNLMMIERHIFCKHLSDSIHLNIPGVADKLNFGLFQGKHQNELLMVHCLVQMN